LDFSGISDGRSQRVQVERERETLCAHNAYNDYIMESRRWLEHAVAANFPTISAANVVIFPQSHELFIADRNVRCTRAELRVLSQLLLNFCTTVSYEQLLNTKTRAVRERELNSLKVTIFGLRKTLRAYGAQVEIRNVYGTGYQAQPTAQIASSP
jgi:DNA-binding response OmpR family regulator